MNRITRIIRQKGGRYRIELDSGLSFPLYRQEMEAYHLEEDTEIPDDIWEEICSGILIKRAKKRSLYLLQKQDRTRMELRSRLLRDGYPEELAEKAVAAMEDYGYIDDKRYAEVYIRYRQDGMSRGALKRKLLEKGIERSLIDEAIDAVCETDEAAIASALLKKKHFDPETADAKERQRMSAYLARRGFGFDLIRRLTDGGKRYTIE